MSHQCSCGRDLNNNYVGYTSAYANSSSNYDRDSGSALSAGGSKLNGGSSSQYTAKLIVGAVGGGVGVKDLRSKEKSHGSLTRTGDRRK